ncbi:DUF4232 domain-containing protein [Streptomyces poriticola]|uniref:DUF4232 domain-containing protein n=1 Tax=Streptomyces poriticola TaxID=3120506 RepID=UPI002FCE0FDE
MTNDRAEAMTYTVRFSFLSEQGHVMSHVEETVADVGAGRTVRRTVTRTGMSGDGRDRIMVPDGAADATYVRISDVKRVPADEAPAPAGSCPESGVRLYADQGDAAMGLRVVGLHLENCGGRPYRLDGHPALELLDEDHRPVDGVEIVHGSGDIATLPGYDVPARAVTLKPGESASAGMAWRNTTGGGTAVNVPYVRVAARDGADPVMVAPELDLGTTGRLAVRPWTKEP